MIPVRPQGDGRRTAIFVFNELRPGAGRLTQFWLARLRGFSQDGWATHAVLINRDAKLEATVARMRRENLFPADTELHHFAARDRRVRPTAWETPPPGESIDPVVSDWLDWLTAQLPGATVFADSPAAYPYLAGMTNPLVSLVAAIHLNHLANPGEALVTAGAELTPRFADRFAPVVRRFDALVTMSAAQAGDLRAQFGDDCPVHVIPPLLTEVSYGPGAAGGYQPGLILSAGRLEPAAHHEQAIDALGLIAEQHPLARLVICGEGEHASAIVARAARHGVAERVSIAPPAQFQDLLAQAEVLAWTARRDSYPLPLASALLAGVPVIANDVRYGPAEMLDADSGVLLPPGNSGERAHAMADALMQVLGQDRYREAARAKAPAQAARFAAAPIARQWRNLAAQLEDQLWDRDSPLMLAESIMTTNRIFRMPGMIVNSDLPYDQWSVELPALETPAGFLSDPRVPGSWNSKTRGPDPAFDPRRKVRPVIVHLRSNALAYVATRTQEGHRLDLTDGSDRTTPILSTYFPPILVVSRVGNSVLSREPDGSVQIAPISELVYAEEVDGRVHARVDPDAQPTDVTHAISWGVDIEWSDFAEVEGGMQFKGLLRCKRIAPALHSAPAICVRDMGGYSRVVGQMAYLADPEIDGLSFQVPVGGTLLTDPLVATTQLSRGALALHVGYRGLLHPVGGLWTHGRRAAILQSGPRGQVTLLPSPGGRILAAPGRGRRARAFGAVRRAIRRLPG